MQSNVTAAIKVAEQFGNLIARADYASASALLTQEARKIHSADDIRWTVESMTASTAGTIRQVELPEDEVSVDWPAKQKGDIASVLVRLIGDLFVEPVTVVLTEEAGAIRIRLLEWDQSISVA